MIDQPTIDRILDAANIVDVVSEFVTLRKRGVNLVGLCPFHTDKTPSFYVSPAKNICKCFACGEGGTAVHFIMKHEQLSYYDALRFLAKKYNIEIQEKELTDAEKQIRSDRESMFIVNAFAQQYFTTQLHEHIDGQHIGMRYFIERGFREDIIRKFQLGYSLDKRDAFFQAATKSGYKKEYLEKTGLVVTRDDGSVYDRFRGRVIFPVHTVSGKVVAFGGRVLKKDDKTAKYVNSPESEIYHKSNELYGIYFAKQAIVKADKCFLVEGYTDVISMHQAGIENVVASSGTALTQGQIRLIHRFSNNITVLYDGDAAGIKAALRGIDLLLEEGLNIKVVLLPDGEDPDSFARKQNAASFNDFIQTNETDFIRFKTKLLLEDAGNDPIKRSALISDIVRTIAIIPDNIARSVYVRECSGMLEIDERVVLSEINKIRIKNQEKAAVPPGNRNTYPSNPEVAATLPPSPAPDYTAIPDYPGIPGNGYSEAPAGYPPEEVFSEAPVPYVPVQHQPAQSPYEKYEKELLRYIVRYGERILYNYFDEEQQKQITMRVAEYIKFDLERDELTFYTPLYKEILDEAIRQISSAENFTAQRYFLSHPNPEVSQLAANLISEKYQLSKYHSKFQALEKEEDKLGQLVPREIFEMKNAYISRQIKDIRQQIKDAGDDMDKITELMTRQSRLNEIKGVLSKELGERIVLKM
ncbi:MAG: DNA primase [Parabacteroides sp.]|nr:DNA primase [Parabacteroides sp.]